MLPSKEHALEVLIVANFIILSETPFAFIVSNYIIFLVTKHCVERYLEIK